MKYRIAINKMQLDAKIPPGNTRWAQFNDGFVNRELEQMEIANAIYLGHAYTSWFNGRRKDENFICSQVIAVDMETHDERSSIDYLLKMEFVQVYGGIVHTTPSHATDDPRARVMFFLDQPIDDIAAYEVAVGFVYSMFPGSDVSCIDSSRFFYGCKNATIELPGNTLPVAHMRCYYNRWRKFNEPQPQPQQQRATTRDVQRPVVATKPGVLTPTTFLDYAINDATGQGRNKRGFRLACQLREMGLSQFETEGMLRRYHQAVERTKDHNYTLAEALASVKSAYGKATMVH